MREANVQKNSFSPISWNAFPGELLESELFGQKTRVYTDSAKDKKGLIELADHGTLFLEEIGEMNMLWINCPTMNKVQKMNFRKKMDVTK